MRAPKRKRDRRRKIAPPPHGVDLDEIASRVSYIGSVEHKAIPTEAGRPRPRGDATICDMELSRDFQKVTTWLREGVKKGCVGTPWEGDFPRYVWYRHEGNTYEARLVNQGLGQYKGYPLVEGESPRELDVKLQD